MSTCRLHLACLCMIHTTVCIYLTLCQFLKAAFKTLHGTLSHVLSHTKLHILRPECLNPELYILCRLPTNKRITSTWNFTFFAFILAHVCYTRFWCSYLGYLCVFVPGQVYKELGGWIQQNLCSSVALLVSRARPLILRPLGIGRCEARCMSAPSIFRSITDM